MPTIKARRWTRARSWPRLSNAETATLAGRGRVMQLLRVARHRLELRNRTHQLGPDTVNGTNGIRATSVPATVFPTGGSNLTVSPAAISLAAAASSAPVQVTANVSWNATDNQSWLSVAPTAGTNNGSFTVSATGNTGATSRTGTVTVSGGGISRTISVSQAGQSGTGGIVSNGTYRVLARHSGKALDVSGHGTADGSNVIQWAYGGGNNQRWTHPTWAATCTRSLELKAARRSRSPARPPRTARTLTFAPIPGQTTSDGQSPRPPAVFPPVAREQQRVGTRRQRSFHGGRCQRAAMELGQWQQSTMDFSNALTERNQGSQE